MSEGESSALFPEFAGFSDRAAAGQVAFPCCRGCGKFHWYPMPRCPHCHGRDIAWRDVSGRGEIVSFTRVMHPFDKSRAGDLPYVVALVAFADAPGINLVTNIVDTPNDHLHIGQPVEPVFKTDKNGPIVGFRAIQPGKAVTWSD